MSVAARVTCREAAGRIGVGIVVADPIAEFMAHHSYTTETVLRSSAGERTWWYGGGGDLTEEPIGDDPPFGGEAWVPAWTGAVELTFTIRLHAFWDDEETGDEQDATWWWSGTTSVDAGVESQSFALSECEARRGPPFDVEDVREVETLRGPTLLPVEEGQIIDIVNKAGAVLPGLGVYQPFSNVLLTEQAQISVSAFQPKGDCYLDCTFGGPEGALALVWKHRGMSGGMQMTLVGLPDGKPRHTKLFGGFCSVEALVWDARGERLGAAVVGKGGMRVYVIDADATIVSESSAPTIEAGHDEFGLAVALEWSDDELVATRSGSTGVARAVEPDWRQYGAGRPWSRALSNGRSRTAWIVCAEFPRDPRPRGTTVIAWLDTDESHGHVVVPDHGWAQEGYRFGKLAILEDGRIVAIGTKIWLVDPATSKVVSLGDAGDYPRQLPIHDGRLYNRGPGAWWTALPELPEQ